MIFKKLHNHPKLTYSLLYHHSDSTKIDYFDRTSYKDRPYFLQPLPRKNFNEYNHFNKAVKNFDVKRYPGDEEVLIDVEKFKLTDYICDLIVPKKNYEPKDAFPFAMLFLFLLLGHHYFFKQLYFYFYLNKETAEMNAYQKATGFMPKEHEGKEIWEIKTGGFDYREFEIQLESIEREFNESLKNLK